MNNELFEQFAASNKAYIESMLALANTTRQSAERMKELNLTTTRAALKGSVAGAKTLLAVRSVNGLLSTNKTLAKLAFEKLVAYTRDVYEISCDTQAALNEIYAAQYSEMNKYMLNTLDITAKMMPGDAKAAISALKSILIANTTAYADINKTAKQFAQLADENATTVVKDAVKTTAKNVAKSSQAMLKKAENVVSISAKIDKAA